MLQWQRGSSWLLAAWRSFALAAILGMCEPLNFTW